MIDRSGESNAISIPYDEQQEAITHTTDGLKFVVKVGGPDSSEEDFQVIREIEENEIKKAIKSSDVKYLDRVKLTSRHFVSKEHEIIEIVTNYLFNTEPKKENEEMTEEFYLSPIQLALKYNSLEWLDFIIQKSKIKIEENHTEFILDVFWDLILFCVNIFIYFLIYFFMVNFKIIF